MIEYETKQWAKGFHLVAGVDEVGRGAFAGPLVTCAVVWDKDFILKEWENENSTLHNINDSKKISKKKRNSLSLYIQKHCAKFSIVEISSTDVDKDGVGEANKLAIIQVIEKLRNDIDIALIDHFVLNEKDIPIKTLSITKGDSLSLSIASASIIAKVYRDNLMQTKYNNKYPQYGFNTNVGYGTKKHREAIKIYGLSPIHRRSFSIRKS